MRRDAGAHAAVGAAPHDVEQGLDAVDEAALVGARRPAAEAGVLVQHGQQGQADAGSLGGGGEAQRHLCRVVERRA